jgi:hypothetical protein
VGKITHAIKSPQPCTNANVASDLSGIILAIFTRILKWTAEELEVLLVNARKELRGQQIHAYIPMCVFVPFARAGPLLTSYTSWCTGKSHMPDRVVIIFSASTASAGWQNDDRTSSRT